MINSGVVVYISPKIASNFSIWCLEPVAGVPAIRRLFERLLHGLPASELEFFAVFHDDVMATQLKQNLEGLSVTCFQAHALHRLSALVEFSKAHQSLKTLL